MMKCSLSRTVLATAALVVASGVASAQQKGPAKVKPVDYGKTEFEAKCSSCHGTKGKGDGPVKPFLTRSPPDLSRLAQNNGGILPVAQMYDVITGAKGVSVHGTRDMPVWGTAYRIEAAEYYVDVPYDPESYVRGRVLTLIEYINRLQAK